MTAKKGKRIISFILCFILLLSYQPVNASAPETNAVEKPTDYVPVNTDLEPIIKTLREQLDLASILLIEDVNPWNTTFHHSILQSIGDLTKVSSLEIPDIDLTQYDVVILSSDQYTSTYDNYLNFKTQLEQYTMNGGVVIIGSLAGWNSYTYVDGNESSYELPGGVKAQYSWQEYNTISDSAHPIVTAELTNNTPLGNEDLYDPEYCSTISFIESSLVPDSVVILRDNNGMPTLVEYPLGMGTVLASGLVWEYDLTHDPSYALKAYKDFITYATYIAGIDFTIQGSTAAGITGDTVDITVSMEKNPGIAGFSLEMDFDNQYLTPIGVVTGSAISTTYTNLEEQTNLSSINMITAVWSNATNIAMDTRDLITIRFKIKEDAPTGRYPIGINGMVINELFEELDYRALNGSVSVINAQDLLYGDVYTDGIINIKDAVKLAQYMAGRITLNTYETYVADVHKNELIDIRDAIKLSQYLAGYSDIVLGSN